MHISRTNYLLGAAGLCILGTAVAFWYWTKEPIDPVLAKAFARAAEIRSYTQSDVTQTEISGRTLRIEGIYHNDDAANRYASSATTSLTIPGDTEEHTFNLTNISIGADVYTRVATESELLRRQIAFDSSWHHFRYDAIPPLFDSVAVAGPVIDHLELFRDGGTFVELLTFDGEVELSGESVRNYTFKLSERADAELGGTLETLVRRIGNGTISISVEPHSYLIRRIVIAGSGFHSTTTISLVDEPVSILPPPLD